ncbi:hypothetical protein H696_03852 [Fonticula alba]|uniref:Pre-mRNA-splicing factor CWC26 n=1 Tax=Fonticula alba TaxID=691883 RepID=A0A058Z7C8_FONAL|nr:hypothetical protein H696_03852 [Fonticula alba]KCV69422.1 hypothetical protein H696_03852 [Fonticula alba]|eukprot:XP_009495987.1 hypothetical protein H696_03852 [Fonticula alba]
MPPGRVPPKGAQPAAASALSMEDYLRQNYGVSKKDLAPPKNLGPPTGSRPRSTRSPSGHATPRGGAAEDDDDNPTLVVIDETDGRAPPPAPAPVRAEPHRERSPPSPEISRGPSDTSQETVFRDKVTGKRIDIRAARLEAEKAKQRRAEELEKRSRWGRGIAQEREQMEREKYAESFKEKPFAVYADDEELNVRQKMKSRWGDPLTTGGMPSVSTNPDQADPLAALFGGEKKRSSPDTTPSQPVAEHPAPVLERPRYAGPPAPPNRYDIHPGYRWDGVDRSNGFEKRLIADRATGAARMARAHASHMDEL